MTITIPDGAAAMLYCLICGGGSGIFIGLVLSQWFAAKQDAKVVTLDVPHCAQTPADERAPFVVAKRDEEPPRKRRTKWTPPPYQDPEARLDERDAFFEELKMEKYV